MQSTEILNIILIMEKEPRKDGTMWKIIVEILLTATGIYIHYYILLLLIVKTSKK